jgi:hypothetical protein
VQFIRRYALPELATLVALPLALIVLLLTLLTTRETERQLEASNAQLRLSEAQLQPTFRITYHEQRIDTINGEARMAVNEIAVVMSGNAKETSALIMTPFAMLDRENRWSVAVPLWFNDAETHQGEIARWTSNPRLLRPLLHDATVINGTHMGALIYIRYTDLAGVEHEQYFQLTETYSRLNINPAYVTHMTIDGGNICNELVSSINAREPSTPLTVSALRAVSSMFSYAPMAGCVGEPIYQ